MHGDNRLDWHRPSRLRCMVPLLARFGHAQREQLQALVPGGITG
jgi:hypothetical protein